MSAAAHKGLEFKVSAVRCTQGILIYLLILGCVQCQWVGCSFFCSFVREDFVVVISQIKPSVNDGSRQTMSEALHWHRLPENCCGVFRQSCSRN